jgi:hypothetical protein
MAVSEAVSPKAPRRVSRRLSAGESKRRPRKPAAGPSSSSSPSRRLHTTAATPAKSTSSRGSRKSGKAATLSITSVTLNTTAPSARTSVASTALAPAAILSATLMCPAPTVTSWSAESPFSGRSLEGPSGLLIPATVLAESASSSGHLAPAPPLPPTVHAAHLTPATVRATVHPLDPEEVICLPSISNAAYPPVSPPIHPPYPVIHMSPNTNALSHRLGPTETWEEVQMRLHAEAAAAMSARYASPLLSPPSTYRSACPICLKFYHEFPTSTLACGHTYHTECIRRWLVINATCPYCRMVVSPPSTPSQSPKIIADLTSPAPTARTYVVDMTAQPLVTHRDLPAPIATNPVGITTVPFVSVVEPQPFTYAVSPAISPDPRATVYSLFPPQSFGTATPSSAVSQSYLSAEQASKAYSYSYRYNYQLPAATLPPSTPASTPYGAAPVPVSDYQPRATYYTPQYLPPQASTTSYQAPPAAYAPPAVTPPRPAESPLPMATYWFPAGPIHATPYFTTTTTTTTLYPMGYQFPASTSSLPPSVSFPSTLPAMAPPVTIAPRHDSPPTTMTWWFTQPPGWPHSSYHQLPSTGFRGGTTLV